MVKSIKVTNYLGESVEITLDDGDPEHGLVITSIDGLGPAKANVNTTKLAMSDGSIFNSSRLNERNITVDLRYVFSDTIEEARHNSYKYFPIKKYVDFLVVTDERMIQTRGYIESNEPNIFSKDEETTVSIICPDPYWYSAGPYGITETLLNGLDSLFEFEFSNESLDNPLIEFGEIKDSEEGEVFYKGDAEIGVIITIHAIGPVGNIIIYNAATRERFRIDAGIIKEITGSGIGSGDDIIIKTERKEKSIMLLRNGFYTNILNCMSNDSNWFRLVRGSNIFAYVAEYGIENINFKIENKTIYEGV